MILINGEELDLKGKETEGTDYEKLVKRKMNEIREEFKGRFPLVIAFSDIVASTKQVSTDMENMRTVQDYPVLRMIAIESNATIFKNTVSVRYSNYKKVSRDGDPEYLPKKIKFTGIEKITEAELDKAFYLLFIANEIKNARNCSEIQRVKPLDEGLCPYVFMDEFKANQQALESNKMRSRVENGIYNEYTAEQIKQAAIVWNIAGASNKPSDKLRIDLVNHLSVLNDRAGKHENIYADFEVKFGKLQNGDKKLSLEAEVRGMVLRGIDASCVKQINGNAPIWTFWDAQKGTRIKKICDITPNKEPMESIVEYLLNDQESREFLQSLVGLEPKKK